MKLSGHGYNKFFIAILFGLFAQSFNIKANSICKERRFDQNERFIANRKRIFLSESQTINAPCHNITKSGNDDEKTVPCFAANFTKSLEHDPTTGLLTDSGKEEYIKLLKAVKTGLQFDYNSINLAPGSIRGFINPQASQAFSAVVLDSSLFSMPPFPTLSSPEAAAQMIEVYLQAICRDVKFDEYGTGKKTDSDGNSGSITQQVAEILNDLGSAYKGPRDTNGQVTPNVLFKSPFFQTDVGPYISQFFLIPVSGLFLDLTGIDITGIRNLSQEAKEIFNQKRSIASKREFGVSFDDYVTIQNGTIPKEYVKKDYLKGRRFFINGRDLAAYVHVDAPYQSFYNALFILLDGFPFSDALPYYNGSAPNEWGFATLGLGDVFNVLGTVAEEAQKAAWAQKWRAHRTLRPEAFAALVHKAVETNSNDFNLFHTLFNAKLLNWILQRNQEQANISFSGYSFSEASTYLLGLVFPEGSPVHPSYPSGHAVIAGACATVLKAFFDDNAKIADFMKPVKVKRKNSCKLECLDKKTAAKLTVGGELNKLASNIAFGRSFAGVHYRADGDLGMKLGEEVAISLLQTMGCLYTEQTFNGFELTKFDGTRIKVTPSCVVKLN